MAFNGASAYVSTACRNTFILHSLICRVLLLLLLLLRNASDLRNCTSYVEPPPVPQQLGEKAHLRTVAAVLANATAMTLVYPSVQGPAGAGLRARLHD